MWNAVAGHDAEVAATGRVSRGPSAASRRHGAGDPAAAFEPMIAATSDGSSGSAAAARTRGRGQTAAPGRAVEKIAATSGAWGRRVGEEGVMEDSVYKVIEVIGTSKDSWEDAARKAVDKVAGHLQDLRIAEIVRLDMRIDDNQVVAYRAKVNVSFKYHEEI
jgi:flavin-binding protein dodecin